MTNREKFLEVFGTTEIHQIASNEWMSKEYREPKEKEENQLKVFISQPMRGLALDEVKKVREDAIHDIKFLFQEKDLYFFDNIQEDLDPETTTSLEYLSNDIRMLGSADLVYFVYGWEKSRGCNIEYQICRNWHIPMMFEQRRI